jgi:3-oxoacyl-[acyl-carrier-protein] synthase-3
LTGETYSKLMHPMDRSVRTLFGDAAAGELLGPFVFGTDGSGAEQFIVPAGGVRTPRSEATGRERSDESGNVRSQNDIAMDGPAILRFTLGVIPPMLQGLLDRAGTTRDRIDLFVFHQANRYILNVLCKQCKLDPERFVIDMAETGNTVASTIPIVLAKAKAAGRMVSGGRVAMVGFGVGLSWAGTLAVMPENL